MEVSFYLGIMKLMKAWLIELFIECKKKGSPPILFFLFFFGLEVWFFFGLEVWFFFGFVLV